MDYTVENVIECLNNFPQCAHLIVIGDRGIDDLRLCAPVNGCSNDKNWRYYKLDTPVSKLPWLQKKI